MENIVLTVHLLLALALVIVVLLQRSEGGGLGIGGGGGGIMTGRGAATALSKLTWALGVAFVASSVTLTVLAARSSGADSVIDRLGIEQTAPADATGVPGLGADLLPPPVSVPPATDAPATPPPADGPATPPPVE